jgi:hypothetical protein
MSCDFIYVCGHTYMYMYIYILYTMVHIIYYILYYYIFMLYVNVYTCIQVRWYSKKYLLPHFFFICEVKSTLRDVNLATNHVRISNRDIVIC